MWVCVIVCVGVLVLMHVSVNVCLMWMGVQGANVHCGKKATRRNTGSMGSQGTSDFESFVYFVFVMNFALFCHIFSFLLNS